MQAIEVKSTDDKVIISKWILNPRKLTMVSKKAFGTNEKVAKNRGVSGDTLINLWIQEKLQQQKSV